MTRDASLICEYAFEASHVLRRDDWSEEENERVFGICTRLHGHSYRLRLHLKGAISPDTGMVINFRDVKEAVQRLVLDRVDHRHLNDVMGDLTTAENICHWIAGALMTELADVLRGVELWETASTAAVIGPDELSAIRESLPRVRMA